MCKTPEPASFNLPRRAAAEVSQEGRRMKGELRKLKRVLQVELAYRKSISMLFETYLNNLASTGENDEEKEYEFMTFKVKYHSKASRQARSTSYLLWDRYEYVNDDLRLMSMVETANLHIENERKFSSNVLSLIIDSADLQDDISKAEEIRQNGLG